MRHYHLRYLRLRARAPPPSPVVIASGRRARTPGRTWREEPRHARFVAPAVGSTSRLVSSRGSRASTSGRRFEPHARTRRVPEVRNSGGRGRRRAGRRRPRRRWRRGRAAAGGGAWAAGRACVGRRAVGYDAAAEGVTRDLCGRANRREGSRGPGTAVRGRSRDGAVGGDARGRLRGIARSERDGGGDGVVGPATREDRSGIAFLHAARTAASILDPRSDRPRVYAATRSRRAHPVAVGSMVSCACTARARAREACDATYRRKRPP